MDGNKGEYKREKNGDRKLFVGKDFDAMSMCMKRNGKKSESERACEFRSV